MSVWNCFQSIPPRSSLYARLQVDPAFNALMTAAFDYCGGVFRFVELDPDHFETDCFDPLMEDDENPLGSEPDARRILGEFRAEIARTCREFPGIEERAAAFQGSYRQIHPRLATALAPFRVDPVAWVDLLIFGDSQLAPDLPRSRDGRLGLVSHALLSEAAGLLGPLEPEILFDGETGRDVDTRRDYRNWRQLILSAAELDEVVLVKAV